MEEKYLPIGTICTIKGTQKKVMITGFYSVEFNGNLKIKDYSGCLYPEGLLLPNSALSFNHSDIEKIDFMGYKNEENETFQKLLNSLTGNTKSNDDVVAASSGTYSKIIFDENGVVTFAEPVVKEEKEVVKSFSDIVFDNNDYVVKAENKDVENPFHKEYKEDKALKETPKNKWKIFSNIEFDEYGNVIAADYTDEYKNGKMNIINFDEEGKMIPNVSDTMQIPTLENIDFDENGMIIESNTPKYEE